MAVETRPQPIASRYITYEEYLADEGDNHSTEWVNRKVLGISMVSDEHNDVSIFLMVSLRLWAEEHQAGVVRGNSFNMKTGPNLPGLWLDTRWLWQRPSPPLVTCCGPGVYKQIGSRGKNTRIDLTRLFNPFTSQVVSP